MMARDQMTTCDRAVPTKAVLLLALAAMGVPACQPDVESVARTGIEERDSAGIRIVENPSPPDGSRLGWRIGPESSASIGEIDGGEPYALHRAYGATRLSDGRIVVANNSSGELRVYDASGTHLADWGGRGEGPGEFGRDLARVARWAGDSIVAWYSRLETGVHVFDGDGSFGRSLGMRPRTLHPSDVREDGTILSWDYAGASTSDISTWNGDGALIASIGNFPSSETYEYERPEGGRGIRRVAYGFVLERGFWGDLTFIGITNRYEIRAFGADGSLVRIVRRDHLPRATTRADADFYVERSLSFERDRDPPPDAEFLQSAREVFESTPLAKTFPAFSDVIGDAAGHLWVREYDFPDEERPAPLWTVFDAQGRALGFVETPAELDILEIGEDYLLGRTEDDLGVESIQVWPLERAGG